MSDTVTIPAQARKSGGFLFPFSEQILPVAFFLALIVLWEVFVRAGGVPSYIFPAPSQVFNSLVNLIQRGTLWPNLGATLLSLGVGYALGACLGVILGTAFAEVRILERLIYPLIVALQSMPKVALAPLFVMWFGYGFTSKTVTVLLISLFPVLVNTVIGLKSADSDRVDLLRAMTANRFEVFYYVKLPSAAGHIFAGLQVGFVMALIGALVAEFIGSDKGLGIIIQNAQLNIDTAGMFAVLVILSLIGTCGTTAIKFLQRKVVFWEGGRRADL